LELNEAGPKVTKRRFSEAQIVGVLEEHEAGARMEQLSRRHGGCENTISRWRSQYGGIEASEAKRLRELEAEDASQQPLQQLLDHGVLLGTAA
jgi:putative transposase